MSKSQRFFDFIFMAAVGLLPKRGYGRLIGRLVGWSGNQGFAHWVVRMYATILKVDTDQAEHGLNYPTLQDFFTRKLKPGSRPITPASESIASPVDGKVLCTEMLSGGTMLQAKGITYTLEALLGDSTIARRMEGGVQLTVYLSPRDYHRIHAPVSGHIVRSCHIPGALWPVNHAATTSRIVFAVNERVITWIETPNKQLVAIVKVAAMGVGNIGLSYLEPGSKGPHSRFSRDTVLSPSIPIQKGEEIGVFRLGSTVILIFEPGMAMIEQLPPETPVQMGECIGRLLQQ